MRRVAPRRRALPGCQPPAAQGGEYVIENFRFHTGDVLPKLKVHYRTIGDPAGEPVLVLHGTAGSGASMLSDGFAGALFGPGQPLDAGKHFIILPDAIGTGKSTKPADGLRTAFPKYNYDDMVEAQYRLVKEHLGVRHLRLVIGNSMGGMQTWLWGIRHPDYMDALVPMASLPAPMSGRNRMLRRMLIDSIVTDPAWNDGNSTEQPPNVRVMSFWFSTPRPAATSACRRSRQAARRATSMSTSAWRRRRLATPTTCCSSGRHRAISIRRRAATGSPRRCWRSIRSTTSAIRRNWASSSAR
jgi:homoserine O-acetyltransferase